MYNVCILTNKEYNNCRVSPGSRALQPYKEKLYLPPAMLRGPQAEKYVKLLHIVTVPFTMNKKYIIII